MLTDFGQSRALAYSHASLRTSESGEVKGTSHFMAYELLEFIDNEKAQVICTKASDMWSFGMVIYVWLYDYIPRFTFL